MTIWTAMAFHLAAVVVEFFVVRVLERWWPWPAVEVT